MSSEIQAKLLNSRRATERAGVDRPSTIRQDALIPIDIVIEDLSCGGCRVSGELGLVVNDRVTVGLPGVGSCPAYVVWTKDGSVGLEFDRALTGQDITTVRDVNTLIAGHFGRTDPAPETADDSISDGLSVRRRLGIIAAAAICAWGIAITAIWITSRFI